MPCYQRCIGLAECFGRPGTRAANALRAVVSLFTLAFLAACDSPPPPVGPDVQLVEKAGQEFVDASSLTQSLFQQNDSSGPSKFGVEVFVDISASMHGYVDYEHNWNPPASPSRRPAPSKAAPEKPPASTFLRLLREFANEEELLGYFGFGSDATGAQAIIPYGKIAPVDPRVYTKLNNDYADLLQQFATRPSSTDGRPIERIIITDGVQSQRDLGAGSALSQTVQKLKEWVAGGGVVEVRLLNAPFAGTYYSEELRSRRLPYSYGGRAAGRPFIAISLLTSQADLPMWDRFWARDALSELSTAATLRCPRKPVVNDPITLEPEERIPKDVSVDVLYRNVWDLSRIETLDGYHDLWRASVRRTRTQDDPAPPTYPACFRLKGLKSPTETDAVAELRAIKPVMEVWQCLLSERAGADRKASPTPGALALNARNWHRVETVDLRDFQNGKVRIARMPTVPGTFLLTATLGVPAKNMVQAVMLTATPTPANPPPTDWKAASTLDDSSADNLNKIYNLQPFVEQLGEIAVSPPAPVGTLVLTYH